MLNPKNLSCLEQFDGAMPVWKEKVDSFIEDNTEVSTTEIMSLALGLVEEEQSRRAQILIARHLKSKGWKRKRVWMYRAPNL